MPPSPRSLVFVSVVPSPYQRDVFAAIAERGRVPLRVHYLEHAADDSPWPAAPLAPWEQVLRGVTFGRGRLRSHVNWSLPVPAPGETWIINGAMTDVTTQQLMRRLARTTPWCFWGELPSTPRSGWRRFVQARQYAPLRNARAIVAVGERARKAYQQLVPGTRVLNQPYACRLDTFAAASANRFTEKPLTPSVPHSLTPSPSREVIFLFCGQMIPRKGIDLLLQAFDRLASEGIGVRLHLVGREAGLGELLGDIRAETRARISYRGFLAPEALPAEFAGADIFVLPSRHDGWGVVINQAFGAGLPVIASDAVGAALDLIRPDENGILLPAGDVDALQSAMRRLAEDPALRRSLGTAAAAGAARLSPEHAAVFWEELPATL